MKVLIVEDEMAIAFLLQDILAEFGHDVYIAMRLPQAVACAGYDLDFAILDMNIDGEFPSAVADALVQRGIPFVFASGYGPRGVPPRYSMAHVICKPFDRHDIQEALEGERRRAPPPA